MKITFEPKAAEDITWWTKNNIRIIARIWKLITLTCRTPYEGEGKPEPLKYHLSGSWSRQIEKEHRLVYRVDEERDELIILSCRGHYSGL